MQVAETLRQAVDELVQRSVLSSIELVTPRTERQLAQWNAEMPEEMSSCVHQLILQHCRLRPQAPAVCSWDGDLTYGHLDRLSDRLARLLVAHGIGPGRFVGLYLDKSKWTPVAMLAVMRAGGAFVLLEASYPPPRLRGMCRTLGVRLVLASSRLAADAAALETGVIPLEEELPEPPSSSSSSSSSCTAVVSPQDALFAVFTSGSTGAPKGIVISHTAFCSGQSRFAAFVKCDSSSRVLQFASFAFDLSIQEHVTTLLAGGCLCVPSDEARLSNIPLAVSQMEVSHLYLTPTVARLLSPDDVPSVKTMLLVGEPLREGDIARWASHVRLFNGYGPAECCISAALNRIYDRDQDANLIGSAVGALSWVVDPSDRQRLTPIGAVGELLIEGPIVGGGYVGEPDKTAASFIPSPGWRSSFAAKPHGHIYCTGDLVQYVSGGKLRYLGRKDDQAKLHGQRLELSEVEHHIRDVFAADAEAVADLVVPAGSNSTPILVAFVRTRFCGGSEGQNPDDDLFAVPNPDFREAARLATKELTSRLPSFMVPSALIPLKTVPTTSSGKVDRRKLRSRASRFSRRQLDDFTRAQVRTRRPVSSKELTLQRLVEKVLGMTDFGMDDNFFALGGDSVLSMELTRLAREDFGIHLPGPSIFKKPTLAQLALEMSDPDLGKSGVQIRVDAPPPFSLLGHRWGPRQDVVEAAWKACGLPSAEGIEDIYPCTPLQEAMMALSITSSDSKCVNRSVYLLPRAIEPERLKVAWAIVAQANPILRTRIIQTGVSQALQIVVREDPPWTYVKNLHDSIQEDTRRGIRLGEPLLRLLLARNEDRTHLVVTIHHSLYDGWSLPRILQQVEAAYYGGTPRSRPFSIFIDHIQHLDPAPMEDFWRRRLNNFLTTPFPAAPAVESGHRPSAAKLMTRLGPALPRRCAGVTPATVIKLSWALTLSQFSRSEDVIFGLTLAGRNVSLPGIDQILGPTFATVPQRVRLRPTDTVGNLLRRLHDDSIETMAAEHLGLQRISTLGSGPAAACRFQSLLIIQPQSQDEGASTIFSNPVYGYCEENADTYALTIEVTPGSDDTIRIGAAYDDGIISQTLLDKVLAQFRHNMDQIHNSVDKPLRDLIPMSIDHLHTIQAWNANLPESFGCCVHDIIKRNCQSRPLSPAVVAWDGSLSYRELWSRSQKLTAHLQQLGVRPGTFVMVHVGKSLWVVIAALAVVKAGAAFVLLDASQPKPRMQQICGDTEAEFVLASKQTLASAAALPLCLIQVDQGEGSWMESSGKMTEPQTTPDSPVYAVFTSGSTGRPKGVVVQHRALAMSATYHGCAQLMDECSRVLLLASYTFDVAVAEIFYSLVQGACICIPHETDTRNNLEKAIGDYGVTWVTTTPSLARTLRPSKLDTLRVLSLGGEAMNKLDVDMWSGRVHLINGYGPAECTIDAVVQTDVTSGREAANIGRGVAAVCWIIDPDDSRIVLKPIGAVGELAIEGPILAQGYLKDPEKTKSVFVPYPPWLQHLRHGKSGRIYRTGDLVCYSPEADGTMIYLGRKDHQVKLRGQRIELGEVEHHLRESLPEAREIVAEILTPTGPAAEPLLAAFIMLSDQSRETSADDDDFLVAADTSTLSRIAEVEAALRSQVPSYMVPSVFLPISRVPLTSSGKVDRNMMREKAAALSRRQLQAFSTKSTPKRPPSTAEELLLREAVSVVLGVSLSEIGMDDNFFHLGGDSIAALKVVGFLRDSGYTLTMVDLLSHPRLADLALVVREEAGDGASVSFAPFSLLPSPPETQSDLLRDAADQCGVAVDAIEDIYPCTAMQEALLALSMKQHGDYIAKMAIEVLPGAVLSRVKSSWQAVSDANPILRTRFIQDRKGDGASLQVVLRETLSWSSDDSPLTIAYGQPLAKLRYLCDEGRSRLRLWIHHALYDGASLPMIFQQVEAAYAGHHLRLRPFNSFIAYIQGLDRDESRRFWAIHFQDLDVVMFPPAVMRRSRALSPHLRGSSSHEIEVPSKAYGHFRLASMIQLACAVVFGHRVAVDDVVYGLILAGRNAPVRGLESVVGPTITTVPFRVRLPPTESVRGILSEIEDRLIQMIPHEQLGLQQIRTVSPDAATACNFRCQVIIQPASPEAEQSDGCFMGSVTEEGLDAAFASYPLVLVCAIADDRKSVQLTCNFDSSLMDKCEADILSRQIDHVLHQIVEQPELSVQDLEVASPHDQSRLMNCNDPDSWRRSQSLHYILHEKSLSQPGNLAVHSWDGFFTYDALYKASSLLVQRLRSLDLYGPGTVTAVCMERSRWTVVALLAALRIGSACVLIDSSSTIEQVGKIIQSSGADVILASSETEAVLRSLARKTVLVSPHLREGQPLPGSGADTSEACSAKAVFIISSFESDHTHGPKRFTLEQGILAANLEDLRERIRLLQDSRVLHLASYASQDCLLEIFGCLTSGGCLCIPSEAERARGAVENVQDYEATWLLTTPSIARTISSSDVPSLTTLILGREPVTQNDADRWFGGKATLLEAYAPAEGSFICAAGPIMNAEWVPGAIGPILSGAGWIVSPSDPEKLAAWGAIGELLVETRASAAQQIVEYLGTTASSMCRPQWLSQFRGQDCGWLYRTGELAQYATDGSLKLVGRKERQFKMGGQRINLGEVEVHLQQCLPEEAMAVVEPVAGQSCNSQQSLCAFICLRMESPKDLTELENYPLFAPSDDVFRGFCSTAAAKLATSLPQFMVPRAFVEINYVPRTASGDIDRSRLSENAGLLSNGEETPISSLSSERIPPSSETEVILVDLWAELLGLPADEIGTQDSFFHVGGDSVLAMKLAARVRQQGLRLTVSSIFSNPQLSEMAMYMDPGDCSGNECHSIEPLGLLDTDTRESAVKAAALQCCVVLGQIEDIYPCTPLQEGLISHTMRNPGAYLGFFRYALPAKTDLHDFQSAWRDVAEANPILRTRIIQDGALYQVVLKEDPPWAMVDSIQDFITALPAVEMKLGQPLLQLVLSEPEPGAASEFLLIMHHALYDGWSLQLILDLVKQAYEGRPLSAQPFNSFIRWIKQVDTGACAEYWRSQLEDTSSPMFPILPSADYKPRTDSSIRQKVRMKSLPGITNATVCHLAWTLVVSQLSGSTDVVFGLVLSGRNANLQGIESVTGPTITTVPLRFLLQRTQTVMNELHRLQEQLSKMSSFEQLGLQNIRRLGTGAEAACQFQNLLLVQPVGAGTGDDFWNPVLESTSRESFSTYALEVTCEISDHGGVVSMDYDHQVLDHRQARRVLSQFCHTMEQIQEGCDSPISQLNLLCPSSLAETLLWNATVPEAVRQCVHDEIVNVCLERPTAPAVCAWDGEFTYRELDRLSHSLSLHLQGLGVGPEVLVPILAEKSRWVAIAMLGVIRAGGAMVLLDPAVPFERLQKICRTTNAELIVSSEACKSLSERLAAAVVVVSCEVVCASLPKGRTEMTAPAGPGNALYAIFTSGSTGEPKGIVTEHAALYTSWIHQVQQVNLSPESRALQFASHMFDVSISDYLWTFLSGGCVCVASQGSLRDDLPGAVNRLAVNRLDLTPSMARILRPQEIPSVRTVVLGGEPMSRHDVQAWAGQVLLINGYGPSESSISCSFAHLRRDSDPLNIGKSAAGVFWVVDRDDHEQLLPIGAIGELLIEGHILARGYLGEATKTAAAFLEISPPWLRKLRPRSRLYKTGDLVQYNSDGSLRYVGRKDTQIKIRGQRVELGEVEHQIRHASASIQDVVVELINPVHNPSGSFLAVFVCYQSLINGEAQAARDHDGISFFLPPSSRHREESQNAVQRLKSRLPAYMVPGVFFPLLRIPLSNGKADRKLLRQQAAALSREELEIYQPLHVARRAPETERERALQSVVGRVLQREAEEIGMDDDFFSLGGDSIIAIRLVEQARGAGFTFRVTTVFQSPKLSDLALFTAEDESKRGEQDDVVFFDEHLAKSLWEQYARGSPSPKSQYLVESNIHQILPVTQSAERFLKLAPEYWILNLQGPVSCDDLQSACEAMVLRHGVLRSIFVLSAEGSYLQVVLKRIDCRIRRHKTSLDVAAFTDDYRRQDDIPVPTLDKIITRFAFVETEAGGQALILRLSHAQFDGYSLNVMWRDLKQLYEGVALPKAADYASHLSLCVKSQTEESFAYWRRTLAGSAVSRIDNASVEDTSNGRQQDGLPLATELVTCSQRVQVDQKMPDDITTATVVKAAWAFLLAQLTDCNDVVFSQASNGRSNASAATKDVVGLCLNCIPVRVSIDPAWTAAELMRFLQRQHHNSLDFELLNLRDIVDRCTSWPRGTKLQSNIVHQNIESDVLFSFGQAQACITCCYDWPQPPDEILLESQPLEDGELQISMDTLTSTLSQSKAEMVVDKLCRLVKLFSALPTESLEQIRLLFVLDDDGL